jgi:hypothetical protein
MGLILSLSEGFLREQLGRIHERPYIGLGVALTSAVERSVFGARHGRSFAVHPRVTWLAISLMRERPREV